MKLQWRLATVLLIGMLVASQIATIRYALAVGGEIEHAASEVKAAKEALDRADHDSKEMITHWTTMSKMQMTPAEKEFLKLAAESAATQKALWDTNAHALSAIEDLWKRTNYNK